LRYTAPSCSSSPVNLAAPLPVTVPYVKLVPRRQVKGD
jgi:hypothetical protein